VPNTAGLTCDLDRKFTIYFGVCCRIFLKAGSYIRVQFYHVWCKYIRRPGNQIIVLSYGPHGSRRLFLV